MEEYNLNCYRDRVGTIWPAIRDHVYSLIMGATACDHQFLMERSIVGLLRLAIRLMRREDMSPVVRFLFFIFKNCALIFTAFCL